MYHTNLDVSLAMRVGGPVLIFTRPPDRDCPHESPIDRQFYIPLGRPDADLGHLLRQLAVQQARALINNATDLRDAIAYPDGPPDDGPPDDGQGEPAPAAQPQAQEAQP